MFLNSGSDIAMVETTAVPVINHEAILLKYFLKKQMN